MRELYSDDFIRMLLVGLILTGMMSVATIIRVYLTIGELRRSRAEVNRVVAGGRVWLEIVLVCGSLLGFFVSAILFSLKSTPQLSAMLAVPVVVLVVLFIVAWWNLNRSSERVWLAHVADVRLWKFIDGGKTKKEE